MNNEDEVEVQFEPRPGNRVSVRARFGSRTASHVFEGASREGELFLWLAEELHLELREDRSTDQESNDCIGIPGPKFGASVTNRNVLN